MMLSILPPKLTAHRLEASWVMVVSICCNMKLRILFIKGFNLQNSVRCRCNPSRGCVVLKEVDCGNSQESERYLIEVKGN